VKLWRLRGRVFVFLAREAFYEPDIEVVERFFDKGVACRDFLIQHFVEILDALRDVRRAANAVCARLVALVEGDAGHGILRVLEPEADTFVLDAELAVDFLQKTDIRLIRPIEDVDVGL